MSSTACGKGASPRCWAPPTNRIFCPVRSADGPAEEPQALATLNEIIAGQRVSGVLEADLKNFFGSLDHQWMMRFVEHRVGDPQLLSLIRRWLTVGVLEAGQIHESTEGTPQGGSVSVLLSNVYLHDVLDRWFAKAIKPKLRGEAYLVRYIDDCVVCFEHRQDAEQFQGMLSQRLRQFVRPAGRSSC